MTVLNPEIKQENTLNPVQNDAALSQQKADANLTQNTAVKTEDKQQQNQESTNEDPNWKAFREARKKDRAEKEAAERRAAEKEAEAAALKAAMEAAFSKSAPTPQAYQQYYGMNQGYEAEETEEQKIEKKVNEIIAKKEQQYFKEQQEREQREYPNRLAQEFPDFRNVCSQENLDYLDFHYPELSRPLQRLPEGYDKWADIYRAVKKFIPNHSTAKKEAARADMNSSKPKSISSTGITQPGEGRQTLQEVEQRRAENWARMQRTMKGI